MNSLLLVLGILCGAWTTDTLSSPDGSRAALVRPLAKGRPVKKLPLVVWLHGGIGANNPSKGLVAAQGFAPWADSGGFALLAPSAWRASPWWSPGALERVRDLVERASKLPGVDPGRIVLAGVSDGGSGALWLAASLRERWNGRLKGVALWSTDPSAMTTQGVLLDLGRLSGLPVRWTAGERDHLYPIQDVVSWWEGARRAGIRLEVSSNPDADHDLADHMADLGRFPAWLRACCRTETRK